jgi:hypothetical protein
MKVKIFEGGRLDLLQSKINKWLKAETAEGIQIEVISQSQCLDLVGSLWVTISVWYKETE